MGELHNFLASPNRSTWPVMAVDGVLFNVVAHASTDAHLLQARSLVRTFKPARMMLDSGGYELYIAEKDGKKITHEEGKSIHIKGGINLTPRHVVEAACQLRPDILIGLDFPLQVRDTPEEQEIEFTRKLGYNIKWAIETAELRQQLCPDIPLFIPIQFYTPQHIDLFYTLLSRYGLSFDGISIPVRHIDVKGIILSLVKLYQLGVKKVHLLGVNSFFPMAAAAYLARHLFEWVSMDATNWQASARNALYLNPHNLSNESLGRNTMISEQVENDCPCPWCRDRTFTSIKNLPQTEQTAFLIDHNAWVIENARQELYRHAVDIASLKTYLVAKSRNKQEAKNTCTYLGLAERLRDLDVNKLSQIFDIYASPRGLPISSTILANGGTSMNIQANLRTITRGSLLYETGVEYGDWAINHVIGCAHGCLYPCYAFNFKRWRREVRNYTDWCSPRLVGNALELLEEEIPKYRAKIKTVHLCFMTDPFMFGYPAVHDLTVAILKRLNSEGIPCTLLTKGIYPDSLANQFSGLNQYGITLVSLDRAFQEAWEPYAAPVQDRINSLRDLSNRGLDTWVSIEPYPTPNIVNQDLVEILQAVGFVKEIIFGRMNYNAKVTAYRGYKQFYNQQAAAVEAFCAQNGIKLHVKDGTITP